MKFLYRIILIAIFIVFVLYGTAFMLPAPSIGLNHSLEMYDKDGNLFYASNNDHYGSYINLDQVSPHFLNAVIAIEDKNFYSHSGFDIWGITRALMTNIAKQSIAQGGSTISQQYVKNLFLSNETTWERKIKEAWLTIRIEVHYTKDEILEGYVNALYFGDGIYGIQNAANYYFDKQAIDLNILESSLLAGMINGPELYSPYDNYELTKKRQQLVLKAMIENNYITRNEYNQLKDQDTLLKDHSDTSEISTYGYFRQYIYKELNELGFEEYDGILKINTTLDTKQQNNLTLAINQTSTDDLQEAAVILEPNSGAIRTLIGGKNYAKSQYNRATESTRQMASTIKPLLYYEALLNGFHPLSKFISEKTTFYLENNETYTPTNYNNKYPNKEITLLEAIATSDNIYAVKMHLFLGEETLASRLEWLGLSQIDPYPSLALGTKEISPIQLCSIYNCIASKGMYYEPYAIESIQTSDHRTLYQHTIKGTKKLDETYCLILSQLLTSTFSTDLKGTMSNYQTQRTFAAKTGTSDWDSWLVAYHPEMTLTMWAGYDDHTYLEYSQQTKVREAFHQVFKDDSSTIWYHPTTDIVQVPINLQTCEITQNGTLFWFYQSGKKLRL